MDVINLAFTLDHNFIQHCGIVLTSIFENNETESFVVHIIYDKPSDRKLKPLLKLIEIKGHSYNLHYLNKKIVSTFKISHHVTSATYYRIFIAELLENTRRVIYLDSDIVVTGSLRDLWQTDLSGGAIAGVVKNYNASYFNAGVMLLDLDRWRAASITEKCVQWIEGHNEIITFWDQDVLNAVLDSNVQLLPEKWNYMQPDSSIKEMQNEDIRIIHFVGTHKPWSFYCEHRLKSEYFKYLALSPWNKFKIREETWLYKVIQSIKGLLRGVC